MGPVNELAQFTVGISTPHYLFLNEATEAMINSGNAQEFIGALHCIEGNRESLEACGLPAREDPDELLLHLSQSNAYHRLLSSADRRLSSKVFLAYHDFSRVPLPAWLGSDPSPKDRPERNFSVLRGLAELHSAAYCIDEWSRISPADNAFEDIIARLQSSMHLLVGGLMIYFSMMQTFKDEFLSTHYAEEWFNLMEGWVFSTLDHNTEVVELKIHGLLSCVRKVAGLSPMAAVMNGKEISQVLSVLAGLDKGLAILSGALLSLPGDEAIGTGIRADELRKNNTTPLLLKIAEASGVVPSQGRGTGTEPIN